MRKPCCDKQGTNKGAWSRQEDKKLADYIRLHGEGCWRSLPKAADLQRCGKSCRLRWINYLKPDIKRGNFTPDEEDLIIKLHALLGNRWSLIAGRLPGRTDNEVKNHWNTQIRKKLMKMGIDPDNHKMNQIPQLHFQNQHQQCTSTLMDKAFNPINGDADMVSDAGSCLEDDRMSAGSSHDLNLDLNVPFFSPSPTVVAGEQKKLENTEILESDEIPTLILFN
ncbi:hypothetical protein Dsin_012386 [Dipteronia sinensis]|uniref:Uncharacterized protein n=1 Tax=Dipteronia sinensis TaxID=43782 RepID=A0AAE0AI59_9ROSI|nr:hypothetical protein Dsin_012386 [Dipteronia sinensis]